ncbi:MAG: purine/pyrimidine permease [Deltaproteobacteria bacterium]|jgi:xanthine/uracil permease|nr:purine/pyrimidine permease [Deltaproteobacteria bacterium]
MNIGLDDRPPWPALLLYGLQWWVVTLPCVVVSGAVVAGLHYADWADRVWYLQKLFAASGLISLAQVTLGHRLPLVIGPATVLMVGLVASQGAPIGALYSAMALGGALMAIMGFANRLAALRRFFTPRIVAVILVLIAFTLSPVIIGLILGESRPGPSLALALILILALVPLNEALKGSLKSLTVPLGLVVGTIAYRLWLGAPAEPIIATAPVADPARSLFLADPALQAGPILAFIFCFLALTVNELGSVEAVGRMISAPGMDGRVRRGVGVTGLGSVLSGLLGVIGPVDFSLSAGLIAATKCAARLTFIPAGLALLACAFAPGFIALLVAIPKPIMGAVLLYSMVSQLAGGLSMLVSDRAIANYAQGVTVALPLLVGLLIAFAPPHAFQPFPAILRPIIANGFVMGAILVVLLEHVILRPSRPPADSPGPGPGEK